jgi:hypothetical protein
MMSATDDSPALRELVRVVQNFGSLRCLLTYEQRLLLAERLRDTADAIDGDVVHLLASSPLEGGALDYPQQSSAALVEIEAVPAPSSATVLVKVRPHTARPRPPARPATSRK